MRVEESIQKLKEIAENYKDYKKKRRPNFEIKVKSNDLKKILNGDKALYEKYMEKYMEKVTLTLEYAHHQVGNTLYERETFTSLKEVTEKIINTIEEAKALGWIDDEWNIDLSQVYYNEYEDWLIDVYLQDKDGGGIDIFSYSLESDVYKIPKELTFCIEKIETLIREMSYKD